MAESRILKLVNVVDGNVQTKTYTIAIITVVVVTLLVVGAIRPTVSTMIRINNEIKEKNIVNDQLDSKIDNLTKLGNQYTGFGDKSAYLPLIFPTQGNFSLFLSNIDSISRENGFSLSSISFAAPNDYDLKTRVLKPWSARISVVGSRANLVRYLQSIEAMPMYPVVKQVSYSTNSSKGGTAFNIEVVLYKLEDTKFYQN